MLLLILRCGSIMNIDHEKIIMLYNDNTLETADVISSFVYHVLFRWPDPVFLVVRDVGLYNSIWALLLPNAISTYSLLVLRTAFLNVPRELEESAKPDRANDMQILMRVFLRLVVPTLAVVTLLYAVVQ